MEGFDSFPPDYWETHVDIGLGKDDIDPWAWDKIVRVRNSPIELRRKIKLGPFNGPHLILPKGLRGYIVDDLSAFGLSEIDTEIFLLCEKFDYLPAIFQGVGQVVALTDRDYKIISPFYHSGLAAYAENFKVNQYE